MSLAQRDYKQGIRRTGPLVSIVAPATSTNLYLTSTGRTAVIRKIGIFNRNAANAVITIGDGDFTQRLPGIFAVAGMDLQLTEDQIPAWEFTAPITARSTVGAADPNQVHIQVEVEEYQGPTG